MSENVKATCPNCKENLFEVYYPDKTKYRCMVCNLMFDKEQISRNGE